MKIQFVSDLHLEFAENCAYLEKQPLAVTGDILLVAGDTAYLDLPESGELPNQVSTTGFTGILTATSKHRLAKHVFSLISWDMFLMPRIK